MTPLRISSRSLSRRSFMIESAGVALGVAFGDLPLADEAHADAAVKFVPSAWIAIDGKGLITITAASAEMGQGVMTAMPALVAEDLDADWHNVRVVQAASDGKAFANPALFGLMATGGSTTTRGYYQLLRLAGAQARLVLLGAVASEWKVPVGELSTEPSVVVHKPSNRHIGYGDIAKFAHVPVELPAVTPADLKPLARCRFIGRTVMRVDVPLKVNGTAKFGIDTEVPGMLFGAILRAPVAGPGVEPGAIDDAAARKVKGVTLIAPLAYGVGIVAGTVEATLQAKDLLKVTWSTGGKVESYDSDKVLEEFAVIAADTGRTGVEVTRTGDAPGAIAAAPRQLSATYLVDHVYHATMEPMNATAHVTGDRAEIWAPTQSPSLAQIAVAAALQVSPDNVTVHTTFLGGGFGRRFDQDYVVDAALLSRAAGKPVKLLWSREDDVQHGMYRPLVAQHLSAGLDQAGSVIGWRHRAVSDSIFARAFPAIYQKNKMDVSVTDGMAVAYEFPGKLGEWLRQDTGINVGFWRAVGPGYTKFAIESFIDEVALAKGADPLEFRLSLLRSDRARKVIREAASMASWGKLREERALGVAYSDTWNTHVAVVAEVSLDRVKGDIRVHAVWAAVDPGIAVQPHIVEAQIESGIVHGTGHALLERISIKKGRVEQSNFHDYKVLRMRDAPEVRVKVLPSDNPPGGIGEAGLPPVAPAIGNAVAALAGIRLRHLPMSADRVLAGLKG